MGSICTRSEDMVVSSYMPSKILIAGLSGAGKTTLLYKLKTGNVALMEPTVDFNIETVSYRNFTFTMWDIGGQTATPELYKYHVHEIAAIIYVVDSTASDRLDEARRQLDMVVGDLGFLSFTLT
ncbi:ADP-ribosylation factor H-like [Penaeus indicus]|uniref:ADP-ribosylation factor H-like n=1 Tax=Penaeus indicus TaxID=29960 RepID=UPI00300CA401